MLVVLSLHVCVCSLFYHPALLSCFSVALLLSPSRSSLVPWFSLAFPTLSSRPPCSLVASVHPPSLAHSRALLLCTPLSLPASLLWSPSSALAPSPGFLRSTVTPIPVAPSHPSPPASLSCYPQPSDHIPLLALRYPGSISFCFYFSSVVLLSPGLPLPSLSLLASLLPLGLHLAPSVSFSPHYLFLPRPIPVSLCRKRRWGTGGLALGLQFSSVVFDLSPPPSRNVSSPSLSSRSPSLSSWSPSSPSGLLPCPLSPGLPPSPSLSRPPSPGLPPSPFLSRPPSFALSRLPPLPSLPSLPASLPPSPSLSWSTPISHPPSLLSLSFALS